MQESEMTLKSLGKLIQDMEIIWAKINALNDNLIEIGEKISSEKILGKTIYEWNDAWYDDIKDLLGEFCRIRSRDLMDSGHGSIDECAECPLHDMDGLCCSDFCDMYPVRAAALMGARCITTPPNKEYKIEIWRDGEWFAVSSHLDMRTRKEAEEKLQFIKGNMSDGANSKFRIVSRMVSQWKEDYGDEEE